MRILKSIKSVFCSEITSIPSFLSGDKHTSLNGLRAVAIMLVLLSHFRINRIISEYGIKVNGQLGVCIFFVLSGFLITTGLLKQKINRGQLFLAGFYIKRALRIMPLVYLFLAVIIIISITYWPLTSKKDFFYTFFFLKNLPIPNMPFTAHLWTLSVEIQFYITVPLFMLLNMHRTLFIILLVAIFFPLISILNLYFPSLQSDFIVIKWVIKFVNYFFWKGPLLLFIGCSASILAFRSGNYVKKYSKYYYLSFFLLLLAIALSTETLPIYYKYISEYLSAILIALVILLNISSENLLSKLLSTKIFVKIGMLSYSLYIWQQFIAYRHYFWIPWLKGLNTLPDLLIIGIKFLIIFPIAYLSYRYFEMPFLKLKERFNS